MQAVGSKFGAPDQSKFYDNILGTKDGANIDTSSSIIPPH